MIGLENGYLKESAALYLKAARVSRDPNNRYRYYYMAAEVLQDLDQPNDAVKYLVAAIETLLNDTPELVLCDPTDALARARATSRNYVVRLLYHLTSVLLYNAWNYANLLLCRAVNRQFEKPLLKLTRLAVHFEGFIIGGLGPPRP